VLRVRKKKRRKNRNKERQGSLDRLQKTTRVPYQPFKYRSTTLKPKTTTTSKVRYMELIRMLMRG